MANSAQRVFKAVSSVETVSTGNPNLDGSGSIINFLVGSSNGSFVKSIIVKAIQDTSEGMIRVFVKPSGGTYQLISESYVLPTIKSGRDQSFSTIILLNYTLGPGDTIGVSTENSESFSVFMEGFEISYVVSSNFLATSVEYIPSTGMQVISVANPNLNGSGTLVKVFTADGAAQGAMISNIFIKAEGDTSPGMVRFFIAPSGGAKFLFAEVEVPSVIRNQHLPSFQFPLLSGGTICIAPGYEIWASTENSDHFSIVVEANDWNLV